MISGGHCYVTSLTLSHLILLTTSEVKSYFPVLLIRTLSPQSMWLIVVLCCLTVLAHDG